MRIFRLLKLSKVLRLFRVVRFLTELRLVFNALQESTFTVFWCLLMLALILFGVSLVIVQGLSNHLVQNWDEMAQEDVDIAVIEAGASPLEPYNGETAIELLRPHIKFTILCASDPYAAYGFIQVGEIKPDLIAGITCNTKAGQELVKQLTGVTPIRLDDPDSIKQVDALLSRI